MPCFNKLDKRLKKKRSNLCNKSAVLEDWWLTTAVRGEGRPSKRLENGEKSGHLEIENKWQPCSHYYLWFSWLESLKLHEKLFLAFFMGKQSFYLQRKLLY